jgi:hypothetical protein
MILWVRRPLGSSEAVRKGGEKYNSYNVKKCRARQKGYRRLELGYQVFIARK